MADMLRLSGQRVRLSAPVFLGCPGRSRWLSTPPAQQLMQAMTSVFPGLTKLRHTMDDHVIGHDDIKEAMMLSLLAREHCYLEGQPGVAKTMLSEIVSISTDLRLRPSLSLPLPLPCPPPPPPPPPSCHKNIRAGAPPAPAVGTTDQWRDAECREVRIESTSRARA